MTRDPPRPLVHLVSLGCPKNRVDTEMMARVVLDCGLGLTAEPAEADVIVVNTCAFVEDARRESIETILDLADERTGGRCRSLVVAGCLAQGWGEEIRRGMPEVDHVVGIGRLDDLAAILRGRTAASRRVVPFPTRSRGRWIDGPGHTAYLKIGEGCSRRCAFCTIPRLRGPARSRSLGPVLEEARRLVGQGVREIVLVSQDTAAWGRDLAPPRRIHELVERLARVRGLAWLRILYLYPDRRVLDLADVVARESRVVPYVDLPLQHVTDRMLRLMRRGHGARWIRRVVAQLRERIPGLTLRTTFVVGHPGETREDFEALLGFIERHAPEHVGLMAYSAEEGTPSARLRGRVPASTVRRRLARARALAARLQQRRLASLVGRTVRVMVDGPSTEGPWLHDARMASQAPEIDGKVIVARAPRVLEPGSILPVVVRRVAAPDLVADLVEDGDGASTLASPGGPA